MPNPPDYVFDEVPRPTGQSTPEQLVAPPLAPVPPTESEVAAEMEATYRGHAQSKFKNWHPLDDIKAQKVEEEVQSKMLEDARRETPSEKDLFLQWLAANPEGGPAWYTPARDIIIPGSAWVGTYALHEIGVPEGSELFTLIEQGLHPSCKPLSASDMPFIVDYEALSWPRDAGPSRRFVKPWQDKLIRLYLKQSGLTKPGSPTTLPSVNLWDLLQREIPEPKYLIQDLLRERGAAMIHGAAGCGKSWFVHSLMICMAIGQGEMLHGALQFPSAGIPILHIDGEQIDFDFQQRTKQLISALALDIADPAVQQGLARITSYLKTMRGGCPFIDLSDPSDKDRILSEVLHKGFKLVIFDNLSTLCPGLKSENDMVSWIPLNELIVALKGLGCAVILVHHSGRSGKSYRGSSNLVTALDKEIGLEKVEDGPAFRGAQFTVMAGKNRNGDDLEINEKILQLTKPKDGEAFLPWFIQNDDNARVRQYVRLLTSLHYMSQEEIGKNMDPPVSQSTAQRLEYAAIAQKLITKVRVKELRKLAYDNWASESAETEELHRENIQKILMNVKLGGD